MNRIFKNLSFLLLSIVSITALSISCENNDANNVANAVQTADHSFQRGGLRAAFTMGKTHAQQVSAYNLLAEGDQRDLWVEKMDQLLTLNLPANHKALIGKIRAGLENGVDTNTAPQFLSDVAALARITPKRDFGLMFETFDDYQYTNQFHDNIPVPTTIVNDIQQFNLFRGSCSCRWCIGHEDHTSTNCNQTSSGCGFLWLQSCNQCILCL